MTLENEEAYFKDTEGVIQVFEFDYDAIIRYKVALEENNLMFCFCIGIPCYPCWSACGKDNLIDNIRCQHLAVTQDGIRYVKERHKDGCRMDCEDKGRITKTVPFDKITDCDLEEPAGAEGPPCCMVQRVLTKVNVDTASGSRGADENGHPKHELTHPCSTWQVRR